MNWKNNIFYVNIVLLLITFVLVGYGMYHYYTNKVNHDRQKDETDKTYDDRIKRLRSNQNTGWIIAGVGLGLGILGCILQATIPFYFSNNKKITSYPDSSSPDSIYSDSSSPVINTYNNPLLK
jgi:hypothetical protein